MSERFRFEVGLCGLYGLKAAHVAGHVACALSLGIRLVL